MHILSKNSHDLMLSVFNTDTSSNTVIGKLSIEILELLESEGFKFNKDKDDTHDGINLSDKWELKISDELANKLADKAFKIAKPIRHQSKKLKTQKIDAYDVVFGIANYK